MAAPAEAVRAVVVGLAVGAAGLGAVCALAATAIAIDRSKRFCFIADLDSSDYSTGVYQAGVACD